MSKKYCEELLDEFSSKNLLLKAEKLKFNVKGKDIYNITAPFEVDGKNVIAGRVESRDSEYSQVKFFEEIDGIWEVIENTPVFDLQDPFVTMINDELILGGVEIYETGIKEEPICYRTIFLRGKSLSSLERFAVGPDRMKDIRLLELPNKKILVMTRPQGEIGGRGTIGFIIIDNLSELNIENILRAKLLDDMFYTEEWGGANELHLLDNNKVGVLSHIASFDDKGNRHYYSTVFTFDYNTFEYSDMEIIATRNNFQEGEAKRPDLIDVIFSGGLIRYENGSAELYCGVSDAEAHKIEIKDPFIF